MEKLLACIATADVDGLVRMLSEDVVVYTDGGGVVSAAIRPVTGAARIANIILHLVQKTLASGDAQLQFERVNGSWAIVIRQATEVHSVSWIEGTSEVINRIYIDRNPDKLQKLSQP